MKISTKFIGSSVIVVGLIVSVAIGSDFLLRKAETSAEVSRDRTAKSMDNLLHLEVLLRDQLLALKDFLMIERDPLDMAKYQKAMSYFQISLDELERLMPDNPELAVIRRQHQFLNRLSNELSDTPSTQARFNQDFRAISSFGTSIDFYLNSLAQNVQHQDELAREEATQFKMTAQVARITIIGIIILVFVGQFMLFLLPVINSIQKLQLGTTKIGAGNLDYRLDIQTGDEIEQLAKQFNQMAAKLTESYRSLEQKVIDRTLELRTANQNLSSEIVQRQQTEANLHQALHDLKQTQAQLIQTEKMSSLGQMVAGVAHEINNPVNFIHGNLNHANTYIQDLLDLVRLYQQLYSNPDPAISELSEDIDLDFLSDDLPKVLSSMKVGTERIRQIVLSLRNFSRLDEADMKPVDIHEGIDSSLLILQNRLKAKPNHPDIKIIKEYGKLPLVECYPGQLNQVFMNILSNAIDALDSYNTTRSVFEIRDNPSKIVIRTEVQDSDYVIVRIADNGPGMTEEVKKRLFDPFFTTKPVGSGTGLGLSITYQIIVEKHRGSIWCESEPGQGAEFWIQIPVRQGVELSTSTVESTGLKLVGLRGVNHENST